MRRKIIAAVIAALAIAGIGLGTAAASGGTAHVAAAPDNWFRG
jgi:hypothetical protein